MLNFPIPSAPTLQQAGALDQRPKPSVSVSFLDGDAEGDLRAQAEALVESDIAYGHADLRPLPSEPFLLSITSAHRRHTVSHYSDDLAAKGPAACASMFLTPCAPLRSQRLIELKLQPTWGVADLQRLRAAAVALFDSLQRLPPLREQQRLDTFDWCHNMLQRELLSASEFAPTSNFEQILSIELSKLYTRLVPRMSRDR